jgi:hypothetical protein
MNPLQLRKDGVISAANPIPSADIDRLINLILDKGEKPTSKGKARDPGPHPSSSNDVVAGSKPSGLDERPPPPGERDLQELLALDLDLISPENPLLSQQDRVDLAVFDQLTRSQAQIHQLLGVEVGIVDEQTWNHNATIQLINLAQASERIPFGRSSDLFDLNPTGFGLDGLHFERSPLSASRKGKEKMEKPAMEVSTGGQRSVFNFCLEDVKEAWLGDNCAFLLFYP